MSPPPNPEDREVTDYGDATEDRATRYGSDALTYGDHAARPVQVADAPKAPKRPSRSHALTQNIWLLFYIPYITQSYTVEDLLRHLRQVPSTQAWDATNLNDPFLSVGLNFELRTDPKTVREDLGRALAEDGSIVIYFGHTISENVIPALGLRPSPDPTVAKYDLRNRDLAKMLKSANAKAVLILGCASNECVAPQKGDVAIIAADSGKDRRTISNIWAIALETWLEAFRQGNSIKDCNAAANSYLIVAAITDPELGDRFVLVSGDASMTYRL